MRPLLTWLVLRPLRWPGGALSELEAHRGVGGTVPPERQGVTRVCQPGAAPRQLPLQWLGLSSPWVYGDQAGGLVGEGVIQGGSAAQTARLACEAALLEAAFGAGVAGCRDLWLGRNTFKAA